jgi:hypothetical protein
MASIGITETGTLLYPGIIGFITPFSRIRRLSASASFPILPVYSAANPMPVPIETSEWADVVKPR